ncbi:putative reverse transcriptase domain-containing protein [Tanacetum coccineum]
MPTTCSGMTPEAIEEMITRRVAKAIEAYDVNRNQGPMMESGDEQEDDHGDNHGNGGGNGNGNGNGGGNGIGNGNGNGNGMGGGNGDGNPNTYAGDFVPVARKCTYQDFLKCQPLNFKGTEGVVGLTRWFEKMETVFYISNCPLKYQVKYVSCTLQDSNALMKLMTEMVLEEEDRVKKFIGGLPDNIQGNVIATGPTRLKDAIRIAKFDGSKIESNCKRVGHMARDCKAAIAATAQRAPVVNRKAITCHPFDIDLTPVELGSFDVIIGMDWLAKYHAVIACDEKIVHISYRKEVLIIQGDRSDEGNKSRLSIISCTKTQKYIHKGCQDFPEVFPKDLPGIPPTRKVEFQIDLVLGAAPVARASYRLAPFEMQKLSAQLQELYDKGFIRPSSS